MVATIKTTVSIQKTLSDQAETLAQKLNIPRSRLFETIIEDFIRNYQSQLLDEIDKENPSNPNERAEPLHQDTVTVTQIGGVPKVISQGDIYWAQLEDSSGLQPNYAHPHVVIQDNIFNRSHV